VSDGSVSISLLLPTRGRPTLLQRLFESLANTTADLSALEVVLYVDEDDTETQQISHPSLFLVKLIGTPGQKMGNMNRACYEASRGRHVMLMNDDVVFRTKGWEARVLEAFGRFPDEVALVYGNDLHQRKGVPTFPIVSRRVCELIGGICPRDYLNVYIDVHLHDIFKKLARLGHDRLVYLDDVIFEHMHHEVGKSLKDHTYAKKDERADDFIFISLDDERRSQAQRLAQYIEGKKKSRSEPIQAFSEDADRGSAEQRFAFSRFLARIFGRV
jgi:glycosyltransferase involved in cell wall biosynthesis